MSTHVDDLRKLRLLSVRKRRQLVRDLANLDARDSAQDLRDLFLKVQTAIEAIDRVLSHEQSDAAQSWPPDASWESAAEQGATQVSMSSQANG